MNIDTTYNICIIERWVNQSQQLIRCRKNLNFKGDAIETCCAISKGLAHIIFELHEPASGCSVHTVVHYSALEQ